MTESDCSGTVGQHRGQSGNFRNFKNYSNTWYPKEQKIKRTDVEDL